METLSALLACREGNPDFFADIILSCLVNQTLIKTDVRALE